MVTVPAKKAAEEHVAIIWQRFLPYHKARISRLRARLSERGCRLTAIEVASQDDSYSFMEESGLEADFEHIRCLPGASYHRYRAGEIYQRVLATLEALGPDLVLAPAMAFPEGMAAFNYRLKAGKRAVMMDDAWEHTDRRGTFIKRIKQIIQRNIDAAFIPASSHLDYYRSLGFPEERIVFGVDVVDNEYFAMKAAQARAETSNLMGLLSLPKQYFLFVGRFLPRKGLEDLVSAYRQYRRRALDKPWALVLVGTGTHSDAIRSLGADVPGIIFAGAQQGDSLCYHYGLASAAVVPSRIDPWGLVVNEALASGLPVIVSRGCGAARTLVREGENGWTFDPGSVEELSQLMCRISGLPAQALAEMGRSSQAIVAEWSLDRFAEGALRAYQLPRRPPGGPVSDLLTRLWRGRPSIT